MADFKEILRHGANYLAANLATKALAFISIPVYTRLLSTHDYGIVSIFIGVAGIMSNLLTLCIDQSTARYYFDKKDERDFKQFVGTSVVLASLVFVMNSIILITNAPALGRLVKLDTETVYLLLPYCMVSIVGLTFDQIFNPMKQSKKIATSSLFRVYLGFTFAVIFIFIFKDKKYLGQILGLITAGAFMIVFWVRNIRKYFIFSFKKEYIKYILTYSVPLIPYALSGVIIEQFGKITLGSSISVSTVGYYSLALTISSIVSIITVITHQAWSPYYFEYMNSKEYVRHDQDITRIFRISLVAAMTISIFGKEIGQILASAKFTASLNLIPIFTYGYVFHQLSYVYMRNVSFVRKSYLLTVIVLISGTSNILLNLLMIPAFGEIGAALSFAMSYMIMALAAWIINKYVIRHHGTRIILLLLPLLVFALFSVPAYMLYRIPSMLTAVPLKAALLLTFIIFTAWPERQFIRQLISKRVNK